MMVNDVNESIKIRINLEKQALVALRNSKFVKNYIL